MAIILCLGVTTTWWTVLQDQSIRKVENHCLGAGISHYSIQQRRRWAGKLILSPNKGPHQDFSTNNGFQLVVFAWAEVFSMNQSLLPLRGTWLSWEVEGGRGRSGSRQEKAEWEKAPGTWLQGVWCCKVVLRNSVRDKTELPYFFNLFLGLWNGSLDISHGRQNFKFRELSGPFNFSALKPLLALCGCLSGGSYDVLNCNKRTTIAWCFYEPFQMPSHAGGLSVVGAVWLGQPNLMDNLGISASIVSSRILSNFSYFNFLIAKITEFKINTHKGTKDCSANALLLLIAVPVLTHGWLSGGNERQRVGGEAGPQRAAAFTWATNGEDRGET